MNPELARYLREYAANQEKADNPPRHPAYHTSRWRVCDRLSKEAITDLIAAFKAGTPKHELATRYGINVKSVQKLLREHGVKRKSRYDIQS